MSSPVSVVMGSEVKAAKCLGLTEESHEGAGRVSKPEDVIRIEAFHDGDEKLIRQSHKPAISVVLPCCSYAKVNLAETGA